MKVRGKSTIINQYTVTYEDNEDVERDIKRRMALGYKPHIIDNKTVEFELRESKEINEDIEQ